MTQDFSDKENSSENRFRTDYHMHDSGALFDRRLGGGCRGGAIFDAKCKACHGADGQGNPAIAKMMKVEMKPLGESSADIKKVVTEGQGKMKPLTGVAGADLDNVVAYVHSLKK